MDQLKPIERPESKFHRHHNLRLAYFSQHHMDSLDLALTPLQHMTVAFPKEKEQVLRVQLARFGIGGDLAVQLMATLSGGQKSRVVFATVTMSHPQLLIFDEPTNHLDFEAIAALTKVYFIHCFYHRSRHSSVSISLSSLGWIGNQ
jgi:ATP-binding cassette subfamily F protein 3